MVLMLAVLAPVSASAFSLALDSIAEWGKFPRFCIDVYRWGDKFFNSYDSTYVKSTGYKFNVKAISSSWVDYYYFSLPNDTRVEMNSDGSTSLGAYLTYMAVSVGYDINLSNIFRGTSEARSRYMFGFDCSLLSVNAYWEHNEVSTHITRFGYDNNLSIPFSGVKIESWGLDAYYFFNHKKYSQPAAFSFSKIQTKSHGSFYAGLAIYSQDYDFDFSTLPGPMKVQLPTWWNNYHYRVKTKNYGFRLGYGYNWAFKPKWMLGVSFSPTIGLRKGFVNSETETNDVSLFLKLRTSLVWNDGRWFAGLVGNIESAIINDRKTLFMGNSLWVTAAVGYRFNLW